jgi:4-hydroxythreonine-4-phosphate dehydrogenase
VTTRRLERTLNHIVSILKQILPNRFPRIGVAALNPHAGEDGVIGKEELEIIRPFCESFSNSCDFSLGGPIPAETLFREAFRGRFDGIIAMYHDQAMIPLKLAGVGHMVNVTLGLPFIRTSPDHGTAFDIARTGAATPKGMQLALDLAARLIFP